MTPPTDVRARDLMRTQVVTLNPDASIREAVQTPQDDHLGGVPVVDAAEKVVGFLSLADIARIEHLQGDRVSEMRGDRQLANPVGDALEEEALDDEEFFGRDDYSPEMLGRETVGQWMTRGVVSVDDILVQLSQEFGDLSRLLEHSSPQLMAHCQPWSDE